mmetsp:Transcript_28894/g.65339  ORF Transcript_28894/g.65339 Transcript_28894/m.65339 type:complete len:555 (+) Transcript_28894:78-1742(+)
MHMPSTAPLPPLLLPSDTLAGDGFQESSAFLRPDERSWGKEEEEESEPFSLAAVLRTFGSQESSGARRIHVGRVHRPLHLLVVALLAVGLLGVVAATASRGHLRLGLQGSRSLVTLAGRAPCTGKVWSRILLEKDDPCAPSMELSKEELTWEIVFNGSVNVREVKDLSSKILGLKWKCGHVVGHREGAWVKLHGEPGYIIAEMGGFVLLRKTALYEKISQGKCADIGKYPITDADACQAAAESLGFPDTGLEQTSEALSSPEGCYVKDGKSMWLATGSANVGNGASRGMEPLCATYAKYAPEPCEPFITTTATTTTSSTTTWGWPSLFCFSVINTTGEQPKLVKAQLQRHASIFSCDESDVFSPGRVLELGNGQKTIQIKLSDEHPNVFQKAWERVRQDGRYKKHDWTVKVDPDTVFFPHRLRGHVSRHTTHHGLNKFFINCNIESAPRLIGSMEVFSRQAVSAYLFKGGTCARKFHEKGWDEERFMEECLKLLGSSPVNDYGMLSDRRCVATAPAASATTPAPLAPCKDSTKVAYHDYADVGSYVTCLEQALQ